MAGAIPKHLLTFKKYSNAKGGGRWFKQIENKVVYFGCSKTKSNRQAYNQAVEKYKRYLAERLGEPKQVKVVKKKRPSADNIKRPSLSNLIDVYLAEQKCRHLITLNQPESLSSKRRLGVSAHRSIKDQLQPFKIWVERKRIILSEDPLQTETMLRHYRAYLDDLMLAKQLSPTTISNRVRGLRRFIEWLWQRRHITEMPRGLDEICVKYTHKSTAKSLTVKQIHTLWNHADDKMKAIIIVCLNCGMYPREAAQLIGKDIHHNYLVARRPKTGVPGKWQLWDVTKILIAKTRTNKGKEELLWHTRMKQPLIHDTADGRSDALFKPWKKLCNQSKVKATMSQLRDTASTFIEGIGKREGMPSLEHS